jgi:BON domain
MPAPTVPTIRRLAILAVLVYPIGSAAAQSAGISHPSARQGVDSQPEPRDSVKISDNSRLSPGVKVHEKAHVPFLPPGTPNTADQTNEKPAPHVHAAEFGYGGPDTKVGQPAMIDVDGSGIIQSGRRALAQQMGPLGYTIVVQFDRGVMTLSGKVPSLQVKADAEQAVRGVPGVTDVQNKLLVATP